MTLTIYHNPRCSKSRQTLALIEGAGQTPKIVRYLDDPLSENDLRTLFSRLGFDSARDMMRTGEAVYKELQLATVANDEALIKAMAANPILIERPIVVTAKGAAICRPPERVKEIL